MLTGPSLFELTLVHWFLIEAEAVFFILRLLSDVDNPIQSRPVPHPPYTTSQEGLIKFFLESVLYGRQRHISIRQYYRMIKTSATKSQGRFPELLPQED